MTPQVRPSCPDCGRWLTKRGSCRECDPAPPPRASTKRLPKMANP